jgi:outer membrane lipoprotein-sorting protein
MKSAIKNGFFILLIAILAGPLASTQTSSPAPSADAVVAKMMELDAQRQSGLTGYAAVRRYVAVNKKRRAEMLVRITCSSDGAKQFSILSEEGSGSIRKHVFYKLLQEETEASLRGTRNSTRLTPENYNFYLIGQETLETGPAYVLAVVPKIENKYLIDGKIWVDATDYAIVRIEGQPARNPSFWVHSVHFVHTYQKVHQFWFASSTHTSSQVRFFGAAELIIENSGYALNSQPGYANGRSQEAKLAQ